MVLRSGDKGDPVRMLQRDLNKLGYMLLVDGDFGNATSNAIISAREQLGCPGGPEADENFLQAAAAAPDPFPPLTAAGVTFIAREEVSDAASYQKRFQMPTCPPAASGVTIGIGYDCRFVSEDEFEADWGDVLSGATVTRLSSVLGRRGSPDLLAPVADVVVPLTAAMRVFATRSLPKYLALTRIIYPQVDAPALSAAQRTALVSLVYNRGTDLTGDRRSEMRAIRDLLAAGRFDEVAGQFESMTRLWRPETEGGVIKRRRAEATLWREGFGPLQLE